MSKTDKPEDTIEANLAIKRGGERIDAPTGGKILPGTRFEYALHPLGSEGQPVSDTEKALIRASGNGDFRERDGERGDAERNTVVEGNHGGGEEQPDDDDAGGPDTIVEGNHRKG